MDPEMRDALNDWLLSLMKEHEGPSRQPTEPDNWRGSGGVNYLHPVLQQIVPSVANEIESIRTTNGIFAYTQLWALLPNRVIGVLMLAGAADYLPPVEEV